MITMIRNFQKELKEEIPKDGHCHIYMTYLPEGKELTK
jgi:hypothetical protein